MPHVCPWWGGYFIDNPLRRPLHDPDEDRRPLRQAGDGDGQMSPSHGGAHRFCRASLSPSSPCPARQAEGADAERHDGPRLGRRCGTRTANGDFPTNMRQRGSVAASHKMNVSLLLPRRVEDFPEKPVDLFAGETGIHTHVRGIQFHGRRANRLQCQVWACRMRSFPRNTPCVL